MNKILMWLLIILGFICVMATGFYVYEISNPVVDKKPAIYLYPEQDSLINVKLNINGKIIKDEPPYNDGWNVFVTKTGLIENKYDYLFYEAKLKKIDLPSQGWIVKYENLEEWFDENLVLMGLNEKEITQFKEYWLKELPESNYYEIKLLEQKFLEKNMNLIITPEADTLIRLNFYFTPTKNKIEISEPTIKTLERKGFTVVEWGGILDN